MANHYLKQVVNKNYEYGFITAIESDTFAPGLSEDVVRRISQLKMSLSLCCNGVLKRIVIGKH